MFKPLTALFIAVLVAACQSLDSKSPDSPYFRIPRGSKLVLNQPIIIAPDSLKIYIQGGRLGYAANQYDPFCKFELRQVKGIAQAVEPDIFDIDRVRREADYFSRLDARYLLAGLGAFDDGKPSPIIYGTHLSLRSARQPDVFRLTCGHLQDPTIEARHLTINQIRGALGDVFTLQLAE